MRRDVGDAELSHQTHQHVDHLRIDGGTGVAEDLASGLIKLPVAALLRALRAEHRPEVVPAAERLFGIDVVLDVGARDARRAFRAKGQLLAVVRERVHLLFDDVADLADLTREERGRFHEGRAHLLVTIQLDLRPEGVFETVPAPDFIGEDVVHPLDGAKVHSKPPLMVGQTVRVKLSSCRGLRPRARKPASLASSRRTPFGGFAPAPPEQVRNGAPTPPCLRHGLCGSARSSCPWGRKSPSGAALSVLKRCAYGMRVAAVDLGKVRVGLAVSDELGLVAHPRPPLTGGQPRRVIAELVRLAREESIDRFLVGLPLDRHGGEGREAGRARRFAQSLADAAGKDVELVDERLSTVEAARRLREGGVSARRGRTLIDGVAAAVLLQAWLDQHREDAS